MPSTQICATTPNVGVKIRSTIIIPLKEERIKRADSDIDGRRGGGCSFSERECWEKKEHSEVRKRGLRGDSDLMDTSEEKN